MSAATMDFAAARDRMVDGQVRPNKVVDPRVIRAMRRLPRERFLPAGLASRAYADEDVPLPGGRALMEPMVLARLVQLLQVRSGEQALVVACGTGYGAAVLDECGARVTALEDDRALLVVARAVLPGLAPRVALVEGPVTQGWPDGGPYDVILVEGAVPAVPDGLAAQLKAGGRLVAVVARPGGPGAGILAETVMVGGMPRLGTRSFFDCATPGLPQFAARPAFSFY